MPGKRPIIDPTNFEVDFAVVADSHSRSMMYLAAMLIKQLVKHEGGKALVSDILDRFNGDLLYGIPYAGLLIPESEEYEVEARAADEGTEVRRFHRGRTRDVCIKLEGQTVNLLRKIAAQK